MGGKLLIQFTRALTRILKMGVKIMALSRNSWSFTIHLYWDFSKSWSQIQKVGVNYSKFGVNETSGLPYKNIKMSSFKSSENIQKKEGGPDRSVSDNQSSSVTLNEMAMKARKDTVISSFSKEVIH